MAMASLRWHSLMATPGAEKYSRTAGTNDVGGSCWIWTAIHKYCVLAIISIARKHPPSLKAKAMAGASSSRDAAVEDKYRSHLVGEGEKNTQWRHGSSPTYDLVNHLFEKERTKEWPKGSLEEVVQNAIKTWEMELSHKTNLNDFKSINPNKFKFIVNGRKALSGEQTLELGSYNALLQSSLPESLQCYKADDETFESSHEIFRSAFPRGFAWEVISVYSGPPEISLKYRHWGHMEGPYKGHAPTGELVEFYGTAVLKVDEQLRVEEVEIYYDPGEMMAGLLKDAHLLRESS